MNTSSLTNTLSAPFAPSAGRELSLECFANELPFPLLCLLTYTQSSNKEVWPTTAMLLLANGDVRRVSATVPLPFVQWPIATTTSKVAGMVRPLKPFLSP